MIMCDFCALIPVQRTAILTKFRGMLAPGASVLLDVYSLTAFRQREETATYAPGLFDGFWVAGRCYGFLNTMLKILTSIYCVLYGTRMNNPFGEYVRDRRETLRRDDRRFSLRQVAARIGVEPSYLSKIERGEQKAYLTEEKIHALARELDEDPDMLLALSGKISLDIQAIIRKRPRLFAELIRNLKDMPDHAVLRIVREVRDGDW
jgi:transcriptional regulator with XRE-family HTH domain